MSLKQTKQQKTDVHFVKVWNFFMVSGGQLLDEGRMKNTSDLIRARGEMIWTTETVHMPMHMKFS